MVKPSPHENRKSGFKVGPKVGKGIYQGHTQKIKATLIHKAKIKKSYYKDLAAEGYGASGANDSQLGERKGKTTKKVKPILGEQRRGAVDEDEEENEEAESRRNDRDEEEEEEEEDEDDSDDDMKRKIKLKGRTPTNPFARSQPPQRTNPLASSSATTSSAALSKSSSAPTTTRVIRKPRLSSPELAALRQKKIAEKKEWGTRGKRGQPKVGNRIEMLLGRIKKSMA